MNIFYCNTIDLKIITAVSIMMFEAIVLMKITHR